MRCNVSSDVAEFADAISLEKLSAITVRIQNTYKSRNQESFRRNILYELHDFRVNRGMFVPGGWNEVKSSQHKTYFEGLKLYK